jgi:hypothetical protein
VDAYGRWDAARPREDRARHERRSDRPRG